MTVPINEPTTAAAPKPGPPTHPAAAPAPGQAQQQPVDPPSAAPDEPKLFSQADLDRILGQRLAPLRQKADAYDAQNEASKSEAQKAAEQIAALQTKVKAFEDARQIGEWKAQVAKDTGVPAEALAGSTLEEIQAHADILKPLVKGDPIPGYVPSQGRTAPTPPGDNAGPSSVRESRERFAAQFKTNNNS